MRLHTKHMGILLIDCGSVRRKTRGMPHGFFQEIAPPPFNLTFTPG